MVEFFYNFLIHTLWGGGRWEGEGDLASAQFHRKDREGSVSRLVVKLEGRVVHNLISKTEGLVCRVW